MKPGLYDRLRALPRARIAPDTGPMTGSFSKQQPSTIRGEAQHVTTGGLSEAPMRRRSLEWSPAHARCQQCGTVLGAWIMLAWT